MKNGMKKVRLEKLESNNFDGNDTYDVASLMAKVVAVTHQVAAHLAAFADGMIVRSAEALHLEAALLAIGELRDNLMRHWASQHALKKCFGVCCNGFVGVHRGGLLGW
jgi:hypothetical protein